MGNDPAVPDPDPLSFGIWLLERLELMPSREKYGTAKERMWIVLRELLSAHEVEPPSAEHEEEMRQTLFAVQATPRQVAEVPQWLRERLQAIEFTDEEIGEFLVLGYCVKSVYDALVKPPACG